MESDLDELYYEIGISLSRRVLGARGPTRAEAVASGETWLETNKARICKAIKDTRVQKAIRGSGSPHEDQIRAIADIIASHVLGVPPNLLARAILILGEHWFCPPAPKVEPT
jgi:hypothetical protein